MTKPEDNPVTVTLIASNLLASRYCTDWATALNEARYGLKRCHEMIDQEKGPANTLDAEFHRAKDWMGERNFIDGLTKGLIRDKRPGRRKAFAAKWWARLVSTRPDAPAIDDSRTWTLGTLLDWQDAFANISRAGRAEINRANQRKRAK